MHRGIAYLIAGGCALFSTAASAASLQEVTGFGSNPGNLRMFEYIPDNLPANAPVVVALHGCTQSAASYDAEPGWAGLADEWNFALILAEQKSGNNQNACFNWFESGDYQRGFGEALSIKQMVDKALSDHNGDSGRVFVTGLSAGGAMTAVMLATYPDVFAGGAIMAGIPYRCATGVSAGFSCMNSGDDKSPQQWGNLVRNASSHNGPWPKVSIWHGTADYTVRPINATESMEQWTNVHGIDQTPDVSDTVKGYPREVYRDGSGNDLVETWMITGMGHATPVDPGTGADQCGSTAAYITDEDICSSYFIGRFWGLDDSDGTPPTVSITSPADSANVSGSVTIQASASDNVGVARVEFLIDGALHSTDSSSPYSATWNSATATNGDHVLTVRAVDTAGNTATSTPVTVTVSGGASDTTAPSVNVSFPTDGSTVSGTVTLAAEASDDYGVTKVEFWIDSSLLGEATTSGQAGAWTLDWDTTTVSESTHAVEARAYDAAGNVGTDDDTQVTVQQSSAALQETVSDLDGAGDQFDSSGWTLGGYEFASDDHTGGPAGSQSAHGYASSGISCQVGTKTETLSRSVTLGDNPKLSYWRKLDLYAQVNMSTTASFTVKAGGSTIDSHSVTYASYAENSWTQRADLDLSAHANQTVTLEFIVSAYSNVCLEVRAKAWLDDIVIENPDQSPDTTPPSVTLTAPADSSTVSGSVDLTATASDDTGVTKIEFYVDGSLLQVDQTSPYAASWDTTGVADAEYQLLARAYDAAGNMSSDSVTVTVDNSGGGGGGGSPTTVSFDNVDSQDGYVKANSGGSGAAVGGYESWYGLAIGRGSDGKHNRAVLSFDTASLPDTATITDAWITVERRSGSGDPWASPAGNRLVIDIENGCLGNCTIETGDWAAATDESDVAEIMKFTSGTQNSTSFSAAGQAQINKTGTTQLKLRFENDPTSTNYLFIDNGNGATLHVSYQ